MRNCSVYFVLLHELVFFSFLSIIIVYLLNLHIPSIEPSIDISKTKSGNPAAPRVGKKASRGNSTALDTNNRGSSSVTPPEESEPSPPDSHPLQDYTPPPTLSPSPLPPLNNNPTNNHTHDPGRPSHLPCSTQDLPLKSPAQTLTTSSGHSQLSTPPPYITPTTTSHPAVSSALMMTSHPTTSEVIMTPPSDLTMRNFPPFPPPESLLAGNFEEPSSFLTSLTPPVYDPVASLYAAARGGMMLPPPSYSFGSSSLSSSTSIPQTSFTPDHHPTISSNVFISHGTLSSSSSSRNSTNARPKPLPLATEKSTPGPSSLSPSTLSPLTNSDCSPSPITQDVSLPAPATLPSERRNFPLTPSARVNGGQQTDVTTQGVSSPIHATDPVVLNDLHEEWDFLSRSACPVIQTDHDMWAAPHYPLRPGFPRRKSIPGTSSPSDSLASVGTLSSSSHLYSGVYGGGYFPPFASDSAASSLAGFAAVTSISNGAH